MGQNNPWTQLFFDLMVSGQKTQPRGEPTRELLGYQMRFDNPLAQKWHRHPARKLKPEYTCFEFLWYLRGHNDDLSITDKASIWKHLSERGVLQSNYGHYLFGQDQLRRCARELSEDRDSRRATVMILNHGHFGPHSIDIPCTLGITFQIRNDSLHMHVHMRSNDAVFGLGNDAPCFVWTQMLLADYLRKKYPSLTIGQYTHTADSMHIYKRHWEMGTYLASSSLEKIDIDEPLRVTGEMIWLAENIYEIWEDPSTIPVGHHWSKWMVENAKGA